MPRDLRLGLRLTADGKGFVGEVRVSKKALDDLTGSTKRGAARNREYSQSSQAAGQATARTGRSIGGTNALFVATLPYPSGARQPPVSVEAAAVGLPSA